MPPPVDRFELRVNFPIRNGQNNIVPNPYAFVRNRLYQYVFSQFALVYSRFVPEIGRKMIEFSLLVISLFLFITLVYVHIVFVQKPGTCLAPYENKWDTSGILRIEVFRNERENYTLEKSYWKERTLRLQQLEGYQYTIPFSRREEENTADEVLDEDIKNTMDNETENEEGDEKMLYSNDSILYTDEKILIEEKKEISLAEETIFSDSYEDIYIMEFSLEYGYLRLRHTKRKELNISVNLVVLDPDKDECFGNFLDRFLLDNVLGYDNIILESVKSIAQKKEQKGFVRNIVSDVEYIFVQTYAAEKSYIIAGFIMIVFTLTISMLLRHSHHQIFIVIANILHVVFPRSLVQNTGAPVLTVVLALVGMEAIMSEFFNDKMLAHYVILIVWMADMYEAVCCHSTLSKRHWFRFFYLYHFLFYAYNYKFGGVYWPLSLLTSWLFTIHSMVWFFHHYELPRILQHYVAMSIYNRRNGNQPPTSNDGPQPPVPDNDSESNSDGNHSSSVAENPESDNSPNSSSSSSLGPSEPSTSSGNSTHETRGTSLVSIQQFYASTLSCDCPHCLTSHQTLEKRQNGSSLYDWAGFNDSCGVVKCYRQRLCSPKMTLPKINKCDKFHSSAMENLLYYRYSYKLKKCFEKEILINYQGKRNIVYKDMVNIKIKKFYCKVSDLNELLVRICSILYMIFVQSRLLHKGNQKVKDSKNLYLIKRKPPLLFVSCSV